MKVARPVSKITIELLQHAKFIRQHGKAETLSKHLPQGHIPPHILYAEVLNDRETFRPVIKSLREFGLLDPFEEASEITAHAEMLIGKFKPRTELETAILLFRSVIPAGERFPFASKEYFGLNESAGGLNILYDNEADAYLRWHVRPCLLPKDLIEAPAEERIAMCYEYSFLLLSLLRAAGIGLGCG